MKRDTLLLQLLNHFKGHATEAHSCQNNQINNEIMKKCHIFEIQSLNYNVLVDIKYDIIWTQLENFYFNNSQLFPIFWVPGANRLPYTSPLLIPWTYLTLVGRNHVCQVLILSRSAAAVILFVRLSNVWFAAAEGWVTTSGSLEGKIQHFLLVLVNIIFYFCLKWLFQFCIVNFCFTVFFPTFYRNVLFYSTLM